MRTADIIDFYIKLKRERKLTTRCINRCTFHKVQRKTLNNAHQRVIEDFFSPFNDY